MSQIKIDQILSVKYLNGLPLWSKDGKFLAYKWNDGGKSDLWAISFAQGKDKPSLPKKITEARSGVASFAWHPKKNEIIYIQDGNLFFQNLESSEESLKQLTFKGSLMGRLALDKEGHNLAVTDGKTIFFYNLIKDQFKDFQPIGEVFGGRFSQTVHADSFEFSPNGKMLLYTWFDQSKKPYLAICHLEKGNVWRSAGHIWQISNGQWLDDNRFIYRLAAPFAYQTEYYLNTIPAESEWADYSYLNIFSQFKPESKIIFSQKDEERKVNFTEFAVIRPGAQDILFGSDRDGFLHHYLLNLKSMELKQLTFGNCEDYAQAGDRIVWDHEGKTYLYASNRKNRVERHIWQLDPESGQDICLIDDPVTNLNPVFSPDGSAFVYNHSNKLENADLWLYDFESSRKIKLTESMPIGLREKLVESELISYKGAKDWDIDGFLYKPQDFDPNKKYPAIVWVHGGPMRQMRGSWHPSSTYALFYAFNQLLSSEGYVVLSPNFRGGIGYGRDFRHGLYNVKGLDDTIDIVKGGEYLKNLEYVDENKVAVYGLSYGGYMTLHSLGQYPETFACGINIAGLWDIAQWGFWMRELYGNYHGDSYFLGYMEANPQAWALGSPCTYKENINKPLLSLQGTLDPNVDITQQDKLVMDMVKLGKKEDFRAIYYPKESHTFRWRHTWQDAFPQMLEFFAQHLKID